MLVLPDVLNEVPTTTAQALDLFDSLPAVEPEFMLGTWHGAEVPTGHPLEGMLAASGCGASTSPTARPSIRCSSPPLTAPACGR